MLLLNNTRAAQTDDTSRSHSSSEATHRTLIAASNMPQCVQYTSQSDAHCNQDLGPRHTASIRSCTCSPDGNLLLVLHQDELHHLSCLRDTQTRGWIKNKSLKKRKPFFLHWECVWISVCLVPFGQPVQSWASPGLSGPVTYLAEWT